MALMTLAMLKQQYPELMENHRREIVGEPSIEEEREAKHQKENKKSAPKEKKIKG